MRRKVQLRFTSPTAGSTPTCCLQRTIWTVGYMHSEREELGAGSNRKQEQQCSRKQGGSGGTEQERRSGGSGAAALQCAGVSLAARRLARRRLNAAGEGASCRGSPPLSRLLVCPGLQAAVGAGVEADGQHGRRRAKGEVPAPGGGTGWGDQGGAAGAAGGAGAPQSRPLTARVVPAACGGLPEAWRGARWRDGTHQGPSHDSHLRGVPSGGGVSPNRLPPGSCLPSAKKLPPPPLPRVLPRRATKEGTRRRSCDIAWPPGEPAAGCEGRGCGRRSEWRAGCARGLSKPAARLAAWRAAAGGSELSVHVCCPALGAAPRLPCVQAIDEHGAVDMTALQHVDYSLACNPAAHGRRELGLRSGIGPLMSCQPFSVSGVMLAAMHPTARQCPLARRHTTCAGVDRRRLGLASCRGPAWALEFALQRPHITVQCAADLCSLHFAQPGSPRGTKRQDTPPGHSAAPQHTG